MVVTFKCSDPYIATRNSEPTQATIIFEGSKKECEKIMLDIFNKNFEFYASNVYQAIKWSNTLNNYDGLFRSHCHGNNLYMHHDSRYWEVSYKKNVNR